MAAQRVPSKLVSLYGSILVGLEPTLLCPFGPTGIQENPTGKQKAGNPASMGG
jgi:hypothetical protein